MLSDMFNNVQTIKTSAAEEHFIEEFRRRNERRPEGLPEIGAVLLPAAGPQLGG